MIILINSDIVNSNVIKGKNYEILGDFCVGEKSRLCKRF